MRINAVTSNMERACLLAEEACAKAGIKRARASEADRIVAIVAKALFKNAALMRAADSQRPTVTDQVARIIKQAFKLMKTELAALILAETGIKSLEVSVK
jgi:hypothetical protein